MDGIRRFFGGSAPAEAFTISFPMGRKAKAVAVDRAADPTQTARTLGLDLRRPAMAVMGGAGLMTPEAAVLLRSIIEDGLTHFAQANNVTLVDGGTTTGVMGLIGTARARRGYTFPLVGVAPMRKIAFPGYDNPDKIADLDPNHTHFALTSGDDFGAESDMLAGLALAVADHDRPMLGVVINGGEIVKQEAHARATGALRAPLLVLEGSGRLADVLAQARTQPTEDVQVRETLEQGSVHFVDISGGPERLIAWLESFYRF
ncbi:MAG: hypothetical protein KME04_10165 [Pleurocapsa minor GSE-CHR-MK-17-07R]|nr:hypothetical protein [Pleurocapsa minor GSE-CHR-MK 17-07R]